MAKVIKQEVKNGALGHLQTIGIPTQRFTPSIVAQVPIMATGLLAGSSSVGWDQYNNPYFVYGNQRTSLAVVFTFENQIFVYNREGLSLQNLNERLDIIGAVGFGISSGPFKWPIEMTMHKIKSVEFSDYMAVEYTDGDGDLSEVYMPIVVVEMSSIDGLENHFIDIPDIAEGMTAKLQAAIKALK